VVVAYDNYNFIDRVRDQALGTPYSIMRCMTTCICAKSPHLPSTGLWQRMHNTAIPLDFEKFVLSEGMTRDDVSVRCTKFLITDAIRTLHSAAFEKVFQDRKDLIPEMPHVERLSPTPATQLHHLGAIFFDEGTVDGTYGVHSDIWLSKMGFSEDPSKNDFDDRLWLVHGDQKTTQMIRSVKMEQRFADQAYDRRKWMLGPPAYFHILQCLTYMIVRTHWSSPSGCDYQCNLLHDIGVWNRGGLSRENAKYYILEPLIKQSWTTRIVAIFYDVLGEMGLLRGIVQSHDDMHQMNTYGEALERLAPEDFLTAVDMVRTRVFTYDSWTGNGHADGEFTSLCRFLQEIELFLLLRYAVKFGDVGIIRRLVGPLCVFFYGAEHRKYGYEMLHLRWLLSDGVSDMALQRSILASGLVNISQRCDSFQAFDLVLEHVNCTYKLDMRNFKNSTHDINTTFNRLALTCAYSTKVRAIIESQFGERTKNDHTRRSVLREIFGLAYSLWTGGRCRPRQSLGTTSSVTSDQLSQDLITIGRGLLFSKIADFNADNVYDENTISALVDDEQELGESEAPLIDVAGYAEAVDDDFYMLDDDPVFNVNTN
jgi:hypothetical protein